MRMLPAEDIGDAVVAGDAVNALVGDDVVVGVIGVDDDDDFIGWSSPFVDEKSKSNVRRSESPGCRITLA